MEDQARIYVMFSPELKARLNNRIDLRQILLAQGIQADVEWHPVPSTDPGERERGLAETVQIAVLGVSLAAAVAALESAITHYLDHKSVRDSHYGYWVHEPVLDNYGQQVLDDAGKPRLIRRRVSGFDVLPAGAEGGITITVDKGGVSVGIGGAGTAAPEADDKPADG